jgi:hypothetical protein
MPAMEIIVKPLTLLKPRQKKVLIQKKDTFQVLRSSSIMKTLLKLGMRLRNIKNTQQLMKFQIMNYLLTLTGETLMELISLTHIEIKVTAVLATLFLSHKLLK